MATESRAAESGELTCITSNCANMGAAVAATVCPLCDRETYAVPPEGAGHAPEWRSVPGLSAGTIIVRVIFGGFWSIAATVAMIAGGFGISNGEVGPGLIALAMALLCGLYARYIFRGGRFLILFW
jgi:hypothetical protein